MPRSTSSPPAPLNVLIVEDDQNYLFELGQELETPMAGVAVFHHARCLAEAFEALDRRPFDLVMLDVIFPLTQSAGKRGQIEPEAGLKVLDHVAEHLPGCPVIVLSSQTKSFAVDLLIRYREVADYIFKDASWDEIRAKVGKHLEALASLKTARGELASRYELVGDSQALERVRDLLRRVAGKDRTTVLVQGESGTGKELVAHGIHFLSRRAGGPFVVVNCAAIPDNLLESELFGHMAGSFTGAMSDSTGKFELAHGGTIFLDEISELPPSVQAKLLRVLQDHRVQPLGAPEGRAVDIRVVAATNRDLQEEVESGRFREDLFYRLNVFPIHLPPLRDHPEDIPLLAQHFLDRFNREMGEHRRLSPKALGLLSSHRWPGNVRELRNVLERLLIVTDVRTIEREDVEAVLHADGGGYRVSFPLEEVSYKTAKAGVLRAFHRRFLLHHLRENDFNLSKTAGSIGYNRQDLGALVRELGLMDQK